MSAPRPDSLRGSRPYLQPALAPRGSRVAPPSSSRSRETLGPEPLLSTGSATAHRPLRPVNAPRHVRQLALPHAKRGKQWFRVQPHLVVLDRELRLDGHPVLIPLRRAELPVFLAHRQR